MTASQPAEFTRIPKFERILDLEFEARSARASIALQLAGTPLFVIDNMHAAAKRANAALFTAIDELTPEEGVEFGAYRLTSQAFYAARKN